ncbi:MAG TPA: hypothetical protein PLW97_13175, partial [Synergistaceae bacterium]|nr:hypothetical protein [Synergistaceae bacterium]
LLLRISFVQPGFAWFGFITHLIPSFTALYGMFVAIKPHRFAGVFFIVDSFLFLRYHGER